MLFYTKEIPHGISQSTEVLLEKACTYVRLGEAVDVPYAPGIELTTLQRKCGSEASEQTRQEHVLCGIPSPSPSPFPSLFPSPSVVVWAPRARERISWCVRGNFPDAKEAKDVVDPVGVEVLCEVPQAFGPPIKAVLCHRRPIVRRKAPVLPFLRIVIRRGSRTAFHAKEMRIGPAVNAAFIHANGKVPLERDTP